LCVFSENPSNSDSGTTSNSFLDFFLDFDLLSLSCELDETFLSYLSSLTSFLTFLEEDLDLDDFLDLLETASSSFLLIDLLAMDGGVGGIVLIGVANEFVFSLVFSAMIDKSSSSTGIGFITTSRFSLFYEDDLDYGDLDLGDFSDLADEY
jgi:hypothetical protein